MVGLGGGGGEPAAVTAHDFVDDEHAWVGVVLGDDVGEVFGTFFGGGPCAKALADWEDVVVDGFRKADDGEVVVIGFEEGREVSRCGIGVVATDGVEDIDAVFDHLLSGDLLWVLAFLDESAFDAVFDIGQFDAAIADGAAAVLVEDGGVCADFWGDLDAIAEEESFVAAAVADDFNRWVDFGVAFDEGGYGTGQAGSEATGG